MVNRYFDRYLYNLQKSSYNKPKNDSLLYYKKTPEVTLDFIASKYHFRTSTLISAFRQAGIKGLTPSHVINSAEWRSLFDFIQKTGQIANDLYSNNISNEKNILIVKSINLQLLAYLAKKPNALYTLDSGKFEELVAKLLEDQGCVISLTKRTRDGGYDMIGNIKAASSNLIFIAECKRYSPENKVGVEIVRNLYGITEAKRVNFGLLVTTSSFTQDVHREKLIYGPRISLKEYNDLCKWLEPYKSTR
jgi:restriction system protein